MPGNVVGKPAIMLAAMITTLPSDGKSMTYEDDVEFNKYPSYSSQVRINAADDIFLWPPPL